MEHLNFGISDSKIDVLNSGYIRLVNSMGDDLSVARAARVSYNADWRAGEGGDGKLINYLMKNKHSTPFEHVTFTFDVKAPIFVFRQWHRHRTWSYNELSARYTELDRDFYIPDSNVIGTQSKKSKQSRVIEPCGNNGIERQEQIGHYIDQCNQSYELYERVLEQGWPRELARTVLPVSMYSKMFATVNLWNLLKFLELRLHPHAQWEIQQYAKAMLELVEPVVPISIKSWKEMK